MSEKVYHLGRGNEPLGQFPESEVYDGLRSGRFLQSDLAWCEGMNDWQPVKQVFGATEVSPRESVLPPVLTSDGHVGMGVMPTPGTAIASLILGLLPVLACGIGVILSVPGVICGHMALKAINAPGSRYEGRGVAIAGLILNYFWLGLTVLIIIGFVAFMLLAQSAANSGSGF
jgi:hypothetical protein